MRRQSALLDRDCRKLKHASLFMAVVALGISAIQVAAEDAIDHSRGEARKLWERRDLGAPAGVIYDQKSDQFYVSQIGGEGDKKDGNGVISRFDTEGNLLELAWVDGLNGPKGLALAGSALWCSDIDSLVEIDTAKAKIRRRIVIDGAKFLTGISADQDGTLFVGDMLTSRIYRVMDGRVSIFSTGRELESPGALVVGGGRLTIAGWGFTTDYTTTELGSIFAIELKSARKISFAPNARGNWFGLCGDGDSGFFAADFRSGDIFHIDKSGEATLKCDLPRGTSGIAFLPGSKLLVATHTRENLLIGYDLSETGTPEVEKAETCLKSPTAGE